ncbi:MAG TPA: hypothetical protein DEB40_14885 [Elusimicrobia bacterium]|nr:hypothetical protein [Elusimicrobiota bacterium]HBT63021.1 hypothetical protein [Elusimicrobiota bacterium]
MIPFKLPGRRAWWIAALAVLLAAGSSSALIYARCSWDFLFCRLAFNYYLAKDSPEIEHESRSGRSSVYYFTSYYLNAMLSAVEGTEDERLLRRTLRYIDNMLDTAKEFRDQGKSFRVWGPFFITPDSAVPAPILHFTFQAMVPIARAAAVIRSNPRWRKRYDAQARRYIAFVDQAVVQYWYHGQLQEQVPWLNPDRFPIWNDNGSNMGLNLMFLCQATADPLYCRLSDEIGAAFKNKLAPWRTGWIWENHTIPIGSDTDNTPGSVGNQAGVPDTSHTNREAFIMVHLYEMGRIFARADVDRMASTFVDAIWNQSLDDPSFANYIDGNNLPYRVYKKPGLNGSIYHGWALLGGYSPKAQRIVLATIKAILRGKSNPALERNATSYGGPLSLCGHALRNQAILRKGR